MCISANYHKRNQIKAEEKIEMVHNWNGTSSKKVAQAQYQRHVILKFNVNKDALSDIKSYKGYNEG